MPIICERNEGPIYGGGDIGQFKNIPSNGSEFTSGPVFSYKFDIS